MSVRVPSTMRAGKRQPFYTLLAALVRHQSVGTALETAVKELGVSPRKLSLEETSADASPGEILAARLGRIATPAESAVLRSASTGAELASGLADLAAVVETEREGQRAFFNHLQFPLIMGAVYFFVIGFLSLVFIVARFLIGWNSWGESSTWVQMFLVSFRVTALGLFLAIPVVFFLLRRWRLSALSWIPGTEKIFRSARGAWASHLLGVQLKAGIDREHAEANAAKSLGFRPDQGRQTDPLLRPLLLEPQTPASEFQALRELLFRRLENSRAHRRAWKTPVLLWLMASYAIVYFFGYSIVEWLSF